jgi:hypothetical protein
LRFNSQPRWIQRIVSRPVQSSSRSRTLNGALVSLAAGVIHNNGRNRNPDKNKFKRYDGCILRRKLRIPSLLTHIFITLPHPTPPTPVKEGDAVIVYIAQTLQTIGALLYALLSYPPPRTHIPTSRNNPHYEANIIYQLSGLNSCGVHCKCNRRLMANVAV